MSKAVNEYKIGCIRVVDCSDGTREIHYDLLPHQRKLRKSEEPIVYFRAGRGSGKSVAAATIAVNALLKGQRVICLGQTAQAIREVLVPEITKQLQVIIPGEYKWNQTSNKIVFGDGVIYLASYESIESIRGYTSISLAILDEAALAPPDIFSVLAFCMRDCAPFESRIRMMSTPRSDNWLTKFVKDNNIPIITAKTNDNPNISEKEIELMRKTCIDENAWKREFYGEEVDDSTDGILFTQQLLNTACQTKRMERQGYNIGVDCAGLGNDMNAIVVRRGNEIVKIVEKRQATASEMCSIIKGITVEFGKENLSMVYIDAAYGLDLCERLIEYGLQATTVSFGAAANESTVYLNQRAEMYCNARREMDDMGLIGLTEELKHELNATKYILNNSNKIQLIPKADIKVILGRSPDLADALALTYCGPIIEKKVIERKRQYQSQFLE
jgi:hypothetical protein